LTKPSHTLRQTLAVLLKEARTREGLTQAALQRQLAAALGVEEVAPTTISRYERAEVAPPLDTLAALCEVLTGRPEALAEALGEALRRRP
jgi:transcriptional regulator with XRE-family HTH domain